jgi:hypothetical protein
MASRASQCWALPANEAVVAAVRAELTGANGGYFSAEGQESLLNLVPIADSQRLSLAAAQFRSTVRTLHGEHGGHKLGLGGMTTRARRRVA